MTAKSVRRLAGAAAALGVVAVLSWHAVDTSVSDEDARAIRQSLVSLRSVPPNPQPTYKEEIDAIARVQHAVLDAAPGNVGVAYDRTREPKDVFEARSGLCYDRSRAMEKALRYLGFRARHIAIYSTKNTGSALKSLLTKGTPSHAVTEVLTSEGWLVVESNAPWLAVGADRRPLSIRTIETAAEGGTRVNFLSPPPSDIYEQPFTSVFGLYSRHGRFYPPYDPIPDVNYGELLQNLW